MDKEDPEVEKWLSESKERSKARRYRIFLCISTLLFIGYAGILVGCGFVYAYLEHIDPEAWYLDPMKAPFALACIFGVSSLMVFFVHFVADGQKSLDKLFGDYNG